MRDIAKEMVPGWEPFTNKPFLYTGPASQGHNNLDDSFVLPGSVQDDDIIIMIIILGRLLTMNMMAIMKQCTISAHLHFSKIQSIF